MKKNANFLVPSIALLAGSLLYVLFRADSLKMFSWFRSLGVNESIATVRRSIRIRLPDILVYALPDGLWMFSYVVFMLSLWQNQVNRKSFLWMMLMPVVAITSEMGQLFHIVPGTFDPLDVLFYFLGASLPFILYRKTVTFNLKQI